MFWTCCPQVGFCTQNANVEMIPDIEAMASPRFLAAG